MIKNQVTFWSNTWEQDSINRKKNEFKESINCMSLMNTCNEDVGMIAGMLQACSQDYWWMCMDDQHDKNLYVIGGYLASLNALPKCFLIDFINASSDNEAEVLTFSEAIHFLLEDVGVVEEHISIKSI